MAFQTIFKRYELKYMLTLEQKEKILEAMSPHMDLNENGVDRYWVRAKFLE